MTGVRTITIEELIRKALDLPGQLANAMMELHSKQQQVREIQEQMERWEAQMKLDIQNEVNGEGQRRYTNDTARSAMLTLKKQEDEKWRGLERLYAAAKQEELDATVKLERIKMGARMLEVITSLKELEYANRQISSNQRSIRNNNQSQARKASGHSGW